MRDSLSWQEAVAKLEAQPDFQPKSAHSSKETPQPEPEQTWDRRPLMLLSNSRIL